MSTSERPLFDPQPIVLEGRLLSLVPLDLCHAEDLYQAGNDEIIWRYMPVPVSKTVEDSRNWISNALQDQNTGTQVAFAICLKETGKAIGSTRYLDIQRENRALEVGWTWIGKAYQRSGVNTECKYLLFRHAFETLGAVRVQLKTDGRNTQSQNAIERIGAKREGILRKSRLVWDCVYRDTVYFSIIESEWSDVKVKLEAKMIP
jgi:RimJ/RimL family protein N-acetyltransferase